MEAMGMFHEDTTSQSIAGGVHAGHTSHAVAGHSSHSVPVAATHTNAQAPTMSTRGVNSEIDNVSSQRKSFENCSFISCLSCVFVLEAGEGGNDS